LEAPEAVPIEVLSGNMMKPPNWEICDLCRVRFGLEPKDPTAKPRVLWKARPEPKVLVSVRDLGFLVVGASVTASKMDSCPLKEKMGLAVMKHNLVLHEVDSVMPELKLFW
jgi:hypothetical protein